MPYVKQHRRKCLDKVVEAMNDAFIAADGDLNYVLFAYFKRNFIPGYTTCRNFCGELRQCATEIERRLLGPYEDKKREENGDIE